MSITVFTPTYNRANKIYDLYNSLLLQTYKNFEWIIVDDGSVDNTEEVINDIISKNNEFKIYYYKQKNSGKHVAINYGVEKANFDLFFIVDSDDELPQNSLELIDKWEKTLPNDAKFAGIGGLKGFKNGIAVGSSFSDNYIDCTSLERNKHNIYGDKAEVFYTKILKQFPFPSFECENFLTESLVWYRIASSGYKIRWFNEIVYICEYYDDGLSKKKSKFYDNYNGFILQVSEELKYKEISFKEKMRKLLICLGYSKYKNIKVRYVAEKLKINIFIASVFRFCGYIALKWIFNKKYE